MARRALLVGVDVYPDPRNNLNSCVSDTLRFKSLLEQTYGFDSSAIQLLHNQNATLANVLMGLDALFDGAYAGDNIVYFQSSHGYRYADGDTMIEVLCLYDEFFEDRELAERTQALPADVLTVVLDACHSGGMNKVFFPAGGVDIARAKVWQPSPQEAERDVQLYAQVTKFKFFGRTTADTGGAVAKNFIIDPIGVPPAKGFDEGEAELNGALFAACRSDQTAAAGSQPTEFLSAFTYALAREADATSSLSQLSQRVAARLAALNMGQTPIALAPPTHPELLTETFVTMRPAGGIPVPEGDGESALPSGEAFDFEAWLREQLGSLA